MRPDTCLIVDLASQWVCPWRFEGVGRVQALLLWCDHCTSRLVIKMVRPYWSRAYSSLILTYCLDLSPRRVEAELRPLLETVASIVECWCNDRGDSWSRSILNLLGLLQAQPRGLLRAFEWYIACQLPVIGRPGLCSFLQPWSCAALEIGCVDILNFEYSERWEVLFWGLATWHKLGSLKTVALSCKVVGLNPIVSFPRLSCWGDCVEREWLAPSPRYQMYAALCLMIVLHS